MAFRVFLTSIAARDLAAIEGWLTQPGSRQRGKAVAQRILAAIRGLAQSAPRHPPDRYASGRHQLVVDGYVISYRILGDDRVSVERIYGPGQHRP